MAFNGLGANTYQCIFFSICVIAEIVFTFIFVLVVHGSTHERVPKGFAGIAIGFTLVMIHIVSIPIDGTSVNPARSLGPALFVGGTPSKPALGLLGCSNNWRNHSCISLETLQVN